MAATYFEHNVNQSVTNALRTVSTKRSIFAPKHQFNVTKWQYTVFDPIWVHKETIVTRFTYLFSAQYCSVKTEGRTPTLIQACLSQVGRLNRSASLGLSYSVL